MNKWPQQLTVPVLQLVEVVMDLGRPPAARFPHSEVQLSPMCITQADLDYAVEQVGSFDGDNRAGIDCTLHRISAIRNRRGKVIGLTSRVGRAIPGSAAMAEDLARRGASILLLGRPGVGKTTAIREISRLLAETCRKRVVIVDTSNEIGGDGDIPHPGIGTARRMQVALPEAQHRVMIEAVENHMPQVIVIDEISTEAECSAARTIAQRGVQLVATAHGNTLDNLVKNPMLADLIGGIQVVTLGDETAKKRGTQKSILERAGPPTFDVAIEMLDRRRWVIYQDVGEAVDLILAGGSPGGLLRERDEATGVVHQTDYVNPAAPKTKADPSDDVSSGSSSVARERRRAEAAVEALLAGGTPQEQHASSFSPRPRLFNPSPTAGSPGLAQASASSAMAADTRDPEHSDDEEDAQQPKGKVPARTKVYLLMDERSAARTWQLLCNFGAEGRLEVVQQQEDADVVVAARHKIRNNPKVRQAARKAGQLLLTLRATGVSSVMAELAPLMGREQYKAAASVGVDSLEEQEEEAEEGEGAAGARLAQPAPASRQPVGGRSLVLDEGTAADDWAAQLEMLVMEARGALIDRHHATRLMLCFLEDLPGGCTPHSLAKLMWGLSMVRGKKKLAGSSAGCLQDLADASTPRMSTFTPSDLVKLGVAFAELRYFPGDDWLNAFTRQVRRSPNNLTEAEAAQAEDALKRLQLLSLPP